MHNSVSLKIASTILTVAFLLTVIIKVGPIIINKVSADFANAHGITTVAEGTVSNKQYSAAHTDKVLLLFTYRTNFVPEKWEVSIRRYDTKVNKWETAIFEIDKVTYDQFKIGDHFKDLLGRTAYFAYE